MSVYIHLMVGNMSVENWDTDDATASRSYAFLLTPDIYPFNKKYKDREQPFFGIDDRIPMLLTVLLGIQHALAMIGGRM